ncbi:MAG: phosphate ABC transporter permease PstA [Hyphomicrobium sp.]
MIDRTAPQSKPLTRRSVDPEVSAARVKARYRSEARFKAFGSGALIVTTVFVVAILLDILFKGLPAFTQHSLVLDVPVAADVVDPNGARAPDDLKSADYFALARNALIAAVPGVEGRAARKSLTGLLSSGAANDLRNRIVADPSLIGQTIKQRLLLSDDADLHFKGAETPIAYAPARGTATPSDVKGEITIQSSDAAFAGNLAVIKAALAGRLTELKTRLARAALGGQTSADDAAALQADIAAVEARIASPKGAEKLDSQMPSLLLQLNGGTVKLTEIDEASAKGTVLIGLTSADAAAPGTWGVTTYARPEGNRKVNDTEIAYLERLKADGHVESHFNWLFFTSGDSREAELAGILGSLVGSMLMLSVTLALAVPFGVLAAVYLEEFAPKNAFTNLVEININNLAAVPSIVFGLLGLAVFLNFFGLPRSAPLVGGLVLALLVLPTIIIAARASLKAVPPSIKEAALGIGASKQQAVFHHVLPLAMPGIMTGTIIGMAHALGETAPLLMIGMLAFIVDVPGSITDPATALPAQIYIWSDLPEQAFQAKTAAAILVLLAFLLVMNGAAIWLRNKFERRW